MTVIRSHIGVNRLHYAWVIVGLTFVVVVVTAGVRAAPGVLIVPLENEFHWSRATISLAAGVNLMCYGLIGPFAAVAMDRFGVRRTVVPALDLGGRLVCPAMLGSGERTDRADDARIDIGARSGDHARGERRGVELVLRVKNERRVHRAHPRGTRRAPPSPEHALPHRIHVGHHRRSEGGSAPAQHHQLRYRLPQRAAPDRRQKRSPDLSARGLELGPF